MRASFSKLIWLLPVIGLGGGYGISFLFTPRYESSAMMKFEGTTPNLNARFLALKDEVLSRRSLSAIMQDPRLDLYGEERLHTLLEDVIERMKRDIHIEALSPSMSDPSYLPFSIRFDYRDPRNTQKTVQTLITRFLEENIAKARAAGKVKLQGSFNRLDLLEARIAALEKRLGIPPSGPEPVDELQPVADTTLEVVDTPSLPEMPYFPGRIPMAEGGFSVGLALAAVLALFRLRRPMAVKLA